MMQGLLLKPIMSILKNLNDNDIIKNKKGQLTSLKKALAFLLEKKSINESIIVA